MKDVAEYQRTMNIWEHVPVFVTPTLQELRRRGHRLVVISNANGTVRQAFARLGLLDLVDLVVDSAEEGFEKPDRRLFDVAIARVGGRRDRALHVGDVYHVDIVGARAAGLRAILADQANLYADVDCVRIRSIAELPDLLPSL
jgi:putative hydrolase of the HAD superfamily